MIPCATELVTDNTIDETRSHGYLWSILWIAHGNILTCIPLQLILMLFSFATTFIVEHAIKYLQRASHARSRNDALVLISGSLFTYLGLAVCQCIFSHH